MVFCLADYNFIPRFKDAAIAMGNNIDTVRRAGSKYYFLAMAGIEKVLHLIAGLLIGICCLLRKCMHPSVNIGILKAVVMN